MSSDRNRLQNFWDRTETDLTATIDILTNIGYKNKQYFDSSEVKIGVA